MLSPVKPASASAPLLVATDQGALGERDRQREGEREREKIRKMLSSPPPLPPFPLPPSLHPPCFEHPLLGKGFPPWKEEGKVNRLLHRCTAITFILLLMLLMLYRCFLFFNLLLQAVEASNMIDINRTVSVILIHIF